ncbi:kelch-like protein 2-like, partial [Trifolium medium]|nr:kelch-like protein 2-like [Trifolium medium]
QIERDLKWMKIKEMTAVARKYYEEKHSKEKEENPTAELHLDAKDSFFLIGGSYEKSSIADMDMYCTSQNVIKSLKPMNCPRSYASVVELNGGIYVFGGENDSGLLDSGMTV